MSWPYASVTVQRETLRSAASIRLGGSAAPTGSRPSRIAARMAAASRMPPPRHRERRTYRDSFFSDPAAVEDDSRRMMPPAG